MGLFSRTEPEPPRENAVAGEPATPEACARDYEQRVALPQPHQSATRHTWGRK